MTITGSVRDTLNLLYLPMTLLKSLGAILLNCPLHNARINSAYSMATSPLVPLDFLFRSRVNVWSMKYCDGIVKLDKHCMMLRQNIKTISVILIPNENGYITIPKCSNFEKPCAGPITYSCSTYCPNFLILSIHASPHLR